MVVLEPGEAPPLHMHNDTEQVFYVIRGSGCLQIGRDTVERFDVKPGDLVRIPRGTWHAFSVTARPARIPESRLFSWWTAHGGTHMGQPRPGHVREERMGLGGRERGRLIVGN